MQSLLLMILYRRRYVAQREQARMQHFGQPEIPAIMIDDLPSTPPTITRDITSPYQTPVHRGREGDMSVSLTPGLTSADISFAVDTPSRPLQRRQRTSDISMLSIDASSRYVLRGGLGLESILTSSPEQARWFDLEGFAFG